MKRRLYILSGIAVFLLTLMYFHDSAHAMSRAADFIRVKQSDRKSIQKPVRARRVKLQHNSQSSASNLPGYKVGNETPPVPTDKVPGGGSGSGTGGPDGGGDGGEETPPAYTLDNFMSDLVIQGENGTYVDPSPARRTAFYTVIQQLLSQQLPDDNLLQASGFELVPMVINDDTDLAYGLRESGNLTGNGAYVIRISNAKHVVEVPHPLHDSNTWQQGYNLMKAIPGMRMFILNTVHRCASAQESDCAHSTSVCSGHSTYRQSDPAHHESLFHMAHRAVEDNLTDARYLQIHGFEHDPGNPEAIVSTGFKMDVAANQPVNQIAQLIADQLQNGKFAVSCSNANHQDFGFCGTKNLQARYTHNVADNLMCTSQGSNNQRFIHIEQSSYLRSHETIVCSAYANHFNLPHNCQ